jgi:hypothetical protein
MMYLALRPEFWQAYWEVVWQMMLIEPIKNETPR